MPAEVETMAYVREVPWHGLGTKVDHLMTAREALEFGGADWSVSQRPIFTAPRPGLDGGRLHPIPGYVANVRDSDGKSLGIVRPRYHVLQNADAFDWADQLVDDGSAKYETVGVLRGGEVVFLSMELPEGIHVPGDEGDVKPYIVLTNGHNGLWSFKVVVTLIRTVCMNTLNLALGEAQATFTLKHYAGFEGRLTAAREALGITFDYLREFQFVADELVNKPLAQRQVEDILRQAFPFPDDIAPAKFDQTTFVKVLNTYNSSPNLDPIRGTGWAVLNAAAEYLDHEAEYRGGVRVDAASTKAEAILVGRAVEAKQRVLNIVRAY